MNECRKKQNSRELQPRENEKERRRGEEAASQRVTHIPTPVSKSTAMRAAGAVVMVASRNE